MYLTGLTGVPLSPWKNSLRRKDELLSMSGEQTSSQATDGVDFSAAVFTDDFDCVVDFTLLNWHLEPTLNSGHHKQTVLINCS